MDVNDHGLELRSQAIGMVVAGMTQKEVAQTINVSERSIRRWYSIHNSGKTLETKARSGRPPKFHRVAKIVIAKSVTKRRQSTRKLAKRITSMGYPITHTTVRRYLANSLGFKSYKRMKRPKLTNRQKENRLKFARERQEWTVDDFKRVLWSDECPFELFSTPNRQNDRVWARNPEVVPPCYKVKFPPKVHVWGMMSHQALSDLHIVPKGQTITGAYYRDFILANTCKDALKRRAKKGSILKLAMSRNMS